MIDFDLSDKVLVVTGGASGIGRAVVDLAHRQGMAIAILDVDGEAADRAAAELSRSGAPTLARAVDVRDRDAVVSVVAEVESLLGPVHGAVTCAGISRPAPPEDMTDDQWSSVMDVNVTGTFNVVRAVGARMLERGSGSIVTVGSTNSLGGHAHRANYTASKHAILGLVRSIAIDWGRRGVRVNAIAPGVVDTPLLRNTNSEQMLRDTFFVRIPMARPSLPDEQARVAMFLLSEAASYVTGAVLPVDGGLTSGYFNHVDLDD
ncbi:SDR family NAD(P)-dependent oxidoreductase [Nocardioides currus]|uniref:NAD(P)-dependent oxidoreductase n=1 Tax=Nocardioides currus TaxID=2133958 RepID=A0A2R7Z3G9_9ACTN|nr:SDR family NAD(P)-dependent oxidoreductase [Nocardioides currus]PUA82796.1 NAD(P)-dependent oxidoreductase [Nocardioides currus]